jgi:hypothetical protein
MEFTSRNLMKKLNLKLCRYFSQDSLMSAEQHSDNKKAAPPDNKVAINRPRGNSVLDKKAVEFIWIRWRLVGEEGLSALALLRPLGIIDRSMTFARKELRLEGRAMSCIGM